METLAALHSVLLTVFAVCCKEGRGPTQWHAFSSLHIGGTAHHERGVVFMDPQQAYRTCSVSPAHEEKRKRLSLALHRQQCTEDEVTSISLYERQEIKALFDMLDEDGSGDIDEGELKRAFDMLGWTSEKVGASAMCQLCSWFGDVVQCAVAAIGFSKPING